MDAVSHTQTLSLLVLHMEACLLKHFYTGTVFFSAQSVPMNNCTKLPLPVGQKENTLGFPPKRSQSPVKRSISDLTFSPVTWLYLLLTVGFFKNT